MVNSPDEKCFILIKLWKHWVSVASNCLTEQNDGDLHIKINYVYNTWKATGWSHWKIVKNRKQSPNCWVFFFFKKKARNLILSSQVKIQFLNWPSHVNLYHAAHIAIATARTHEVCNSLTLLRWWRLQWGARMLCQFLPVKMILYLITSVNPR